MTIRIKKEQFYNYEPIIRIRQQIISSKDFEKYQNHFSNNVSIFEENLESKETIDFLTFKSTSRELKNFCDDDIKFYV